MSKDKDKDLTDKLKALGIAKEQTIQGNTISPIQESTKEEKAKRGPTGDWPDQETYKTGVKLPVWVWDELERAIGVDGEHRGKTRNMVVYLAVLEYLRK